MTLHHHKARISHRKVNIRAFGDLQMGDPGFRKDLWQRWKREALEDSTSLIIGMGDYSNSFRPTIDKKIQHALVEDPEAYNEFDLLVMKEMQGIAEELKPFKHRIIGLHSGHHNHKMMNGGNTDQYLCQLLGVKYLGFVALTRLSIQRSKGSTYVINIFSTHGCGGSSLVNSDLANLERKIIPYWDCDLFLRGHSTKVFVFDAHPLNYLSFSNSTGLLSIKKHSRLGVNTGGFMEGYTDGNESYVEQKNMPPCALGWAVVEVHFCNRKSGSSGELEITGRTVTG